MNSGSVRHSLGDLRRGSSHGLFFPQLGLAPLSWARHPSANQAAALIIKRYADQHLNHRVGFRDPSMKDRSNCPAMTTWYSTEPDTRKT